MVVPSTHAAEAFANGTKATFRHFGKAKILAGLSTLSNDVASKRLPALSKDRG
jgi:hypothetical protein